MSESTPNSASDPLFSREPQSIEPVGSGRILWLGIVFELALGLIALGLAWLLGQALWEHIHWNIESLVKGLVCCVPMLLLFFVCLQWPVGPLKPIERFAREIVRPLFSQSSLWELALLCIAAGCGEELLFRGALQGALSRWLTPWGGIAAASILFGLMHPITAGYVVLAAGMGVYLGWAYLLTDDLIVVITAHALYDFVALVVVTRGPSTPSENGRPHEDRRH
jgi:uncharacterized protein